MKNWKKQFDKKFVEGIDIDEPMICITDEDEIERMKHWIEVTIQEELWAYSKWLLKNNYCDTDIIQEEPYAVDEYLKDSK